MSETIDIKLETLQEKITLVKAGFSVLLAQNKQLKQSNEQLTIQLNEQNNTISTLEKKYKNLELAKAVSDSSGENSTARKHIEEIVREIDKCIALLHT
ncbi:MAG: hypothetical protein M0R02_00610 [Bacteroidales bacterium]|nr:hypothetical protein [Bacteroidales bacterium]NLK82383.1 hypothetical protein [Bacteroidales bacterium]